MTDRGPEGASSDSPASGAGRLAVSGLHVGRVLGVPVYVTPAWFLVAAFITVVTAPEVAAEVPGLGAWRYVVSASFAVLLYASVFLHELSHTVVALRLGLPVRRVTLHLLGGFSEIEREPDTPGRDFLVAVAGPLLSLLLGGAGMILVAFTSSGSVVHLLAASLALANLVVGVFNLLPGLPLDGGRLLRAGVWKASGRPYTGTLVAAWVGRVLAGLVLVAPLWLLPLLGFGTDLFDLLWSALVASFIWVGASQSIAAARVRERLPSLQARVITRRAIPVTPDLPLAEALRRARESGAGGMVVVDRGGHPTGLVNEAAVTATPEHRRPWVSVSAVSRNLQPGMVISADLSGEDLLAALRRVPAMEYLVTDDDDRVFGVLSATDVDAVFASA